MRYWVLALALGAAMPVMAQSGYGAIANKMANAAKNFDVADKDHDGFLTKEEANSGSTPFIGAHFDKIDKNHAGKVSKEDVVEYIKSVRKPAPAAAPAAAGSTAKP
ncbi:EF-hand domain-containing protein [Dyella terrae]|uniref:EF-hand domain-containing protein n=3 Tax=Rhodanobacteraceae TaxID=1775411 RepID=A0A4R0Z3J3_9GAMM|nr:EF-hand domain-containing protein [Dyella terrae]TCI13826.1 EF-hand domain-containing protein [Dyella soli]